MKSYYAYIRVSTTKQGEQGSSLDAQRSAIERYAKQHSLTIGEWFEEQETAAAQGRPRFNEMLQALKGGKAQGLVVHKIDRGARNLRDWAEVGELIDSGVDVHFAHEGLDLTSRGGRLSADIQAVVAADFIRNLKDEVRKGIYGRLGQGLYPWPAPRGYRNNGAGKPKSIDPDEGPLVTRAFELYATGRYSLDKIAAELHQLGYRTSTKRPPCKNKISQMLNNPFYMGAIHIRKTGETFQGIHKPLVSVRTFEHVQDLLNGRAKKGGFAHEYVYRKAIRCVACGRSLTGERQKGHIYYRCQGKPCKGSCVREIVLDEMVSQAISKLRLSEAEMSALLSSYENFLTSKGIVQAHEAETLRMRLANIEARTVRLTDAYIDRLIDKPAYEERNAAMIRERVRLQSDLDDLGKDEGGTAARLRYALELLKSLKNQGELAKTAQKLHILKNASSNLTWKENELVIHWLSPLDAIANRADFSNGAPRRDTTRTCALHGKLLLLHETNNLFCRALQRIEDGLQHP